MGKNHGPRKTLIQSLWIANPWPVTPNPEKLGCLKTGTGEKQEIQPVPQVSPDRSAPFGAEYIQGRRMWSSRHNPFNAQHWHGKR